MSKILVAFFSASGVTSSVAGKLAEAVDGDLFEILPEVLYTKADLNWMSKKSRSSIEMNDRSSRPAIANVCENMNEYDVVFVGFPIWWYREPAIIDTFVEAYDFSGKVIVPFATSGSSGMGVSSKNIQELAPGAIVKEGKRFSRRVSVEALKEWADSVIGG